MIVLLFSIAWLLAIAGLLLRAITQYRSYEVVGPHADCNAEEDDSVTVIIPARNEEQNIRRCVESILSQDCRESALRIIVVNDHSHDGTANVARQLAQKDQRVTVIDAEPLPSGWLGKPHACWQGAQLADAKWLCFIDADTTAHRPLIGTAVQLARSRKLGLLSLQPFQELGSAWERLILPCGFFLLAFTQDLRQTNNPASTQASVNGQFLFLSRAVYVECGGHAAVKDAVAEDSALARNVKCSGHRIAVLGTRDLLHTRMYDDPYSLWQGCARQLGTLIPGAFGLMLVAAAALLLACTSIALPAWGIAAATHTPRAVLVAAAIIATASSLSLLGTHLGAARYFKIPIYYGLLFPLGYTLGAAVAIYALWRRAHRNVLWKGRSYAAARSGPNPLSEQSSLAPHA